MYAWRQCGTLALFALAAEQFRLIPLLSAVVVWRATHMPTCRKMRSMICAPWISDTGRISCWRWVVIETQQRIDLPHFRDPFAPRSRRNALRLERTMFVH
jgi:hypothetical protein